MTEQTPKLPDELARQVLAAGLLDEAAMKEVFPEALRKQAVGELLVSRGFSASLARPGGNITGVSNLAVGFPTKWLELIKEFLPHAVSVAVLRNLANPTHDDLWNEAELRGAPQPMWTRSSKAQNPAIFQSNSPRDASW